MNRSFLLYFYFAKTTSDDHSPDVRMNVQRVYLDLHDVAFLDLVFSDVDGHVGNADTADDRALLAVDPHAEIRNGIDLSDHVLEHGAQCIIHGALLDQSDAAAGAYSYDCEIAVSFKCCLSDCLFEAALNAYFSEDRAAYSYRVKTQCAKGYCRLGI